MPPGGVRVPFFGYFPGCLPFLFLGGGLHNNAIIVAVSIESLLLILLCTVGVCTFKQMRMLCLCPEFLILSTDENYR